MKYAYSFDEDNFYGEFDSIEKALDAARKDNCDNEDYVFVGIIGEYAPFIDGDSVIEDLQERALEESDYAEGYLDDVAQDAIDEFNTKLNDVLFEWLKKWNLKPNFYPIENVKRYALRRDKK